MQNAPVSEKTVTGFPYFTACVPLSHKRIICRATRRGEVGGGVAVFVYCVASVASAGIVGVISVSASVDVLTTTAAAVDGRA